LFVTRAKEDPELEVQVSTSLATVTTLVDQELLIAAIED